MSLPENVNDLPLKVTKSVNLNPKQTKFVNAYLKDGNGTRAAIEAGYSEVCAASTASRMLRNGKVRQALAEIQAPAKARAEVSASYVIGNLKKIVSDPDAQNRDKCTALGHLGRTIGLYIDKYQDINAEALESYAKKAGIEVDELKAEIADMKASMKGPKLKAVG